MSGTAVTLENPRMEALTRARAGSDEAFEVIVRDHGGVVFSIAMHFFSNSGLAEEIAQEVFLELYKNLKKIESDAHLVAWLRRTTTNRCIDASRRSAFRSEVAMPDLFTPAVGGALNDTLLHEQLRKQVVALPEWQRAVVILRFQEDLDLNDIAELLKIPLNTVKSRLHRAIETLRSTFERKRIKA
jgi:RNA polymerase sigma-70 factor (ECF subfamily)